MSAQAALVKALLRPSAWPHPVDELELIETHISWVILTGRFAYKFLKAIELDFLDFTTLEQRRQSCENELRLNRRWTDEIYVDVVGITGSASDPKVGGEGAAIEYAVRMRQFPQSALLSEELRAGKLDSEDMSELAEMIALRHDELPRRHESRFGAPASVARPMLENFDSLEPWLDQAALRALRGWTEQELDCHRELIEFRRSEGFVRECHGDLHLRNLVRLDTGFAAFDCVEFSDELRILDVISDLTFLSMDLVAAGRADLAWAMLNRYLEVSGDYAGMVLYGLYHVYHCLIRAKVAAIRASERDSDDDRVEDVDRLHHYRRVAQAWIGRHGPALIVMHGLSGSGKTWVSSRVLADLEAVRIRSDIERKRLHGLGERASSHSAPGEGLYTAESTASVYERLFELAADLLAAGHRVILDASFLGADERRRARALAGEINATFLLLAVDAPPEVLDQRVAARQARGTDASEADRAVLDHQRRHADPIDEEQDGPVVRITTRDGVMTDGLVDRIEGKLRLSD